MDFELSLFIESLPSLLDGALLTLQLTVVSVTLGLITGLLMGLGRVSKRWPVRFLASFYVTVFRGVPLLVTLMFLYYGMPSLGVLLSAYTVSIIALTVTNGAYVTEIVRAGIQSIDTGQMRAARSLGMSYTLAMRRIILPQAIRRVLPPITNESITLLKNTALVSTISLADLLRAGLEIMTWKANVFSPFAGVALMYLCMTLPMQALNSHLERRYRMH
jgi:His/Glu/Gln/Arg/opine family amino acid ABC transporter permease subunit